MLKAPNFSSLDLAFMLTQPLLSGLIAQTAQLSAPDNAKQVTISSLLNMVKDQR